MTSKTIASMRMVLSFHYNITWENTIKLLIFRYISLGFEIEYKSQFVQESKSAWLLESVNRGTNL